MTTRHKEQCKVYFHGGDTFIFIPAWFIINDGDYSIEVVAVDLCGHVEEVFDDLLHDLRESILDSSVLSEPKYDIYTLTFNY